MKNKQLVETIDIVNRLTEKGWEFNLSGKKDKFIVARHLSFKDEFIHTFEDFKDFIMVYDNEFMYED